MSWFRHWRPIDHHNSISQSSPPPPYYTENNVETKFNPSALLIVAVLAMIFFICALLHLLVRYLLRPINRSGGEVRPAGVDLTALQGELRQLFHLHDDGVDQSHIDTLPIFLYKDILAGGGKLVVVDPFDCAVCLCEFEPEEELRFLPKCSHAFHLPCIDTWLLSHSTCPLCRRSLLIPFETESCDLGPDSGLGSRSGGDLRALEINNPSAVPQDEGSKVVTVKLGKFRALEINGGEEGKLGRRCFSMGSLEYVMEESAQLRVAIKRRPAKSTPMTARDRPGHRVALSACDSHFRRDWCFGAGIFDPSSGEIGAAGDDEVRIAADAKKVRKKESFSVSKTWLRPRIEAQSKPGDGDRRAVSFRLPLFDWDDKSGSLEDMEAAGSFADSRLVERSSSFARRTMMWIVGRQNKTANHR